MKGQKGITLVALVITIIVLLILAGVAIATLTGKDNILKNSQTAVDKYSQTAGDYNNLLTDVDALLQKHLDNYTDAHPST